MITCISARPPARRRAGFGLQVAAGLIALETMLSSQPGFAGYARDL